MSRLSNVRRRALTIVSCAALSAVLAAGCGSSNSPSTARHASKSSSSTTSTTTSSKHQLAWPGEPRTIAEDAGCSVETPPRLEGIHIGENPYLYLQAKHWNTNPPTSGEHFGMTSKFGFYDQQLQDAYSVHDLEHGGVVIWYGADPKSVEDSFGHVATKLIKVVISPRKQLADGELDLLAWGVLTRCPASVAKRLGSSGTQKFLDTWGASAIDGKWAPERGIPAVVTGTRDSIQGNGASQMTLPKPPEPLIDTTLTTAQAQAQAQAQTG